MSAHELDLQERDVQLLGASRCRPVLMSVKYSDQSANMLMDQCQSVHRHAKTPQGLERRLRIGVRCLIGPSCLRANRAEPRVRSARSNGSWTAVNACI